MRDADTAQAVLHLLAPSDAARSIKRTRPGPRTSLLVISLLTAAVMILVAFHFDRLAALGLAVMFVGAMTLTLLLRRRVPNSRSQPHLVILKGGIS